MTLLRCTAKLLKRLKQPAKPVGPRRRATRWASGTPISTSGNDSRSW